MSYFNWGPSQPVSKETWGCVVIQNDHWYNENCIYPEVFVCETQAERGMLSSVTLSMYTLNIVTVGILDFSHPLNTFGLF